MLTGHDSNIKHHNRYTLVSDSCSYLPGTQADSSIVVQAERWGGCGHFEPKNRRFFLAKTILGNCKGPTKVSCKSLWFRRRGGEDVEASIEVQVDNQPHTFSLSAQLCQVVGMKQATRAAVMHTLWGYIRAHRLQVCRFRDLTVIVSLHPSLSLASALCCTSCDALAIDTPATDMLATDTC